MANSENTSKRRYRYIHEDTDRHGNIRIYFWRGKGQPKIRLRERPGTVTFDAEYQCAITGGIIKAPPHRLPSSLQPKRPSKRAAKSKYSLDQLRQILVMTPRDLLSIGNMGEAIIEALHPEWQRAPPGTLGYDFLDEHARRVQVKTWGTWDRTHDKVRRNVERLVVVQLNIANWDILCDRLIEPDMCGGGSRENMFVSSAHHRIDFTMS